MICQKRNKKIIFLLALSNETISAEQMNPSAEIFHTWSPEYQAWRESWTSSNKRSMVIINNPLMLERFLLEPGAWSIVPQSIAKALQERGPFYVSFLSNPPPERVCYMSVPKHQNARQTFALKLFQTKLHEFLSSL